MQAELEADYPIQILGVNQAGYEVGNEMITMERSLPWLQDVEDVNAWGLWAVNYRDVYILDQTHTLKAIYNLTEHDLNDENTYEELKDLLIDLSQE